MTAANHVANVLTVSPLRLPRPSMQALQLVTHNIPQPLRKVGEAIIGEVSHSSLLAVAVLALNQDGGPTSRRSSRVREQLRSKL